MKQEQLLTNGLQWIAEEMKDEKVIKEVARYLGQLRMERDPNYFKEVSNYD